MHHIGYILPQNRGGLFKKNTFPKIHFVSHQKDFSEKKKQKQELEYFSRT